MNKEAMQQALEALERTDAEPGTLAWERENEAMDALRAALAEQNDDLTAAWMAGAAEERKRAEQAQPVAELVARELERLAQDPPISGNTLAQARVLMAAASLRQFGLGGGASAPVAPPGWRMVPVEPTEAMLSAAQSAWLRDPARKTTTMYRAMLAAAPEAPAPVVPQPLADDDIHRITGHCGVSKHAATSIARAVEAEVLKRTGVQR